jgi:hypothetical protein
MIGWLREALEPHVWVNESKLYHMVKARHRFRANKKKVHFMKYTFKSLPTAALALTAALLFSFVAPAYADGINPTINRAAVRAIKAKLAGTDEFGLPAALEGEVSPTTNPAVPTIQVACSYTLPQLNVDYSASFLGFTFMSGSSPTSVSFTPYHLCTSVRDFACNFITTQIGVPPPLNVSVTGNILQTTSSCY